MSYKAEEYLWKIQMNIAKKYGMDKAAVYVDPLVWYISTGRSSAEFDRKLTNAKHFMIARILVKNFGSHEDALRAVKRYIGC